MIVNADLNHLLKPAPAISEPWISKLENSLQTVLRPVYQPVFEAQLKMVAAVLRIEEEVAQLGEARRELLKETPALKAARPR